MLNVTNKLWIISDTHFGHHNIVKYAGRPDNHEALMVDNWVDSVDPSEQILHMGDVVFGNAVYWQGVVAELPGEKYLILGNHDHKKKEFYEKMGFKIVPEFVFNGVAFSHRPVSDKFPGPLRMQTWWHTNVHGHTHNNPASVEYDGNLHDKKYINVSIEMTGLKPVRVGEILEGGIE